MKRLLLFIFFIGIVWSLSGQSTVHITGYVNDTLGNQVTGGTVNIHYVNASYSVTAYIINGLYEADIQAAGAVDTLVAEFSDNCGNHYVDSLQYNPGDITATFPSFIIDCPPPILVEVHVNVVDSLGLPVPNASVRIINYPYIDKEFTNVEGEAVFYNVKLNSADDTLITIEVIDACTQVYQEERVIHYGPPVFYNMPVGCGIGPRVHVVGQLVDPNMQPIQMSEVAVKVKFKNDTISHYAFTSPEGKFFMDLPIPQNNDSIYVRVVTDCGGGIGMASGDAYFSGANYRIYSDVIVDTSCSIVNNVSFSGYVELSGGGYASNVDIMAYYKSEPDIQAKVRSDSYGYFYMLLPPSSKSIDTILVTIKDGCENQLYDTIQYTVGNSTIDRTYIVSCNGPEYPPYVTISGYVKGKDGKPAQGVEVWVQPDFPNKPMETSSNGVFTNEFGYYTIKFYTEPRPMVLLVKTEDFCYNEYTRIVNFDGDHFVYDSVNFTVLCPNEMKYIWDGVVKDSNNNPLPGIKVKGYNIYDTSQYVIGLTNLQGYYRMEVNDAISTDSVGLTLIDGCGNVIRDTLYFDPDVHSYTNNYVMSCAGPRPDSVISFVGNIQDEQNSAVADQIVHIMLIDTLYQDTMRIATISNEQGFYSVSLPLPERMSTIYWYVKDACDSVYIDSALFDFDNFLYTKDFTVQCPPNYTPMEPKMVIGFRPDWQHYNTFEFFAMPRNLPMENIAYFVWYLNFDTIATEVPNLVYTFPSLDTCLQVSAKLVMDNGMSMMSPPVNLCITDMFEDIGEKCYADFIVTRTPGSFSNYAFVPFVQRKEGLTPVSATWSFGDGDSLTITPPDTVDKVIIHQYTHGGRFNVVYSVSFVDTLQNECTATWSNPVWVGGDVWYPDSCAAVFYVVVDSNDTQQIHFEDISYPGDADEIAYYYWDFGDGEISTVPSPNHLYANAGEYNVSMQIITSSGCSDEMKMTLPVGGEVEPMMFFPDTVASTKGVKAYGVKFRNISKKSKDKYKWDFGDAVKETVITSYDTITHYYADTGYYDVVMQDYYTGAGVQMKLHIISATEITFENITLIPPQGSTGVEQIYGVDRLDIYPNPASNVLNVQLPDYASHLRLEIMNTQGQIIKTIYSSNVNRLTVDISALAPGTYFIRTIRDNNVGIAKFIKN